VKINKIYNTDCFDGFRLLENETIDMVVTSPPYFNARDYSQWDTYENYLAFVEKFLRECHRVLKNSGRIAINVPDGYGRNPWMPIYSDYCRALNSAEFVLRGNIVWHKFTGGGRTSWGSWCSSSNPCLIDEHEMIVIAHKNLPRVENGSTIERDDFLSYVHSVWQIKPETRRQNAHPAPYPVEIPKRLIDFLSGEGAIILDPFMGSGTTAVACLMTNRNYIGFESNKEYYEESLKRVLNT